VIISQKRLRAKTFRPFQIRKDLGQIAALEGQASKKKVRKTTKRRASCTGRRTFEKKVIGKTRSEATRKDFSSGSNQGREAERGQGG